MHALIIRALRDPGITRGFTLADWDRCLPQARAARLLGRLAHRLRDGNLWDAVPDAPRQHLRAALTLADKHANAMRWEVHCIVRALAPLHIPVTLLKGAAYLMAGLPVAKGRLFNDVDILVPRARLNEVEAQLLLHGWHTTHHDAYDQRYYREWMHELPPLIHIHRHNALDVHHTILPPTSRLTPDPSALLGAAVPLPDHPDLQALAPADMVLHSAAHLFHESEWHHGLRDVSDLDSLLRDFSQRAGFWDQLLQRADTLGLQRPLYYALRHAQRVFETPIPTTITDAIARHAPGRVGRTLMDRLLDRALRPFHPSCRDAMTPIALQMLYMRGHWLRMPPLMLARHLSYKALKKEKNADDSET